MSSENMPKGTELVARWRALGLNPHRIATHLGLTWRAVKNIETGRRKSQAATLLAVDAYLTRLERERSPRKGRK